tara:strand:+ start:980 stop:1351 length:372 start_codon:yes stop_codon:yes gene_type:complete
MLNNFIGPVSNLLGGWLNNRAEQKAAEHKRKLSIIENDSNWEAIMAESSKDSWKDEFWTIVLSIPIFMIGYAIAFGDTQIIDRVHLGFEALTKLPEWYQYLLFIAISSSFGIRGVSKLMNLRK